QGGALVPVEPPAAHFEDHGGSAQPPYEGTPAELDSDEEALAAKAVKAVRDAEEAEAVAEVVAFEKKQTSSGSGAVKAVVQRAADLPGDADAGAGASGDCGDSMNVDDGKEQEYVLQSDETDGMLELFQKELDRAPAAGQLAGAVDSEKALMEAFLAAKETWGENVETWNTGSDKAPYDAVLEQCANSGFVFNKRSAMGSRFGLFIMSHWSEEKRQAYKDAGPADKVKFRQDWAAERYAECEKTRKFVQSRSEVDSTIGTLLNLDALIVAEGGHDRPAVVQGAINIALSCIKKGPPFVELNSDSGRLEFRHRVKQSRLDFTKKWETEELERGDPKKAKIEAGVAT
ncbi:unnamed protein product, partial [Prorocentrum cordatum]